MLLGVLVLVKKPDHDTDIGETEKKILDHDKYITAQEFNKLTADNFHARLKEADLTSKKNIADFLKKTDLGDWKNKNDNNNNVTSNKSKHVKSKKKLSQ